MATMVEFARLRSDAMTLEEYSAVAVDYPGVRTAIEHRVGSLVVGDLALACAIASARRSEAFAACAQLVDDVKRSVPIWKNQHFTDGTTEWVDSL